MAKKIKVTVTNNGTQTETETELNGANCREFRNDVVTMNAKPVHITSAVYENRWKDYKKSTTKLFLTDSLVEALKQISQSNVTITIQTMED